MASALRGWRYQEYAQIHKSTHILLIIIWRFSGPRQSSIANCMYGTSIHVRGVTVQAWSGDETNKAPFVIIIYMCIPLIITFIIKNLVQKNS